MSSRVEPLRTSNSQASVPFLSGADDLLTRLLLDWSIFEEPKLGGRSTGKINKFARELRMGDAEVDAVRALVKELRKGTVAVHEALDTLLDLSAVKSFNLKWDDEPLFAHHAKRYILALRPDSGIAFHETDRYKNPRGVPGSKKGKAVPASVAAKLRRDPETFIEVGVFATRAFKKGEVVNLRGGIADLTEEEDDELRGEGGRSDFSVLWSQRKECFCLLLGPARFVNHDCRNNVEFNLVGANMSFKVLEDIAKDEELFTHYGDHYFERDNATCLCATCEQLKQGAFASSRPKPAAAPKPRAASPTPASRRSRRASTIAAPDYNEARKPVASTSGSVAAAQRAVGPGLKRSASLSALGSRSPGRARPRSSRMNPARGELSPADALRGQPRLIVQPKLPPPPGYAKDYAWDARRRIARYTGPTVSPVEENAGAPKAARKPRASAPPALGKRRRAETDSPAPASAAGSPRVGKKPRTSQVQLRQVRLGERSSSRVKLGSASARDRTFAKLRQAMGGTEDDSDLSDLSDEEEEGEEEAQGDEEMARAVEAGGADEAEMKEVEAMLSPQKAADAIDEGPLPFAMPSSSRNAAASSSSVTLTTATATTSRSSRSLTSDTSVSISASTVAFRAVACEVGMSTSTPVEESLSPHLPCPSASEEDDHEDEVVLCAVPDKGKGVQPAPSPRGPISAPASGFYGAAADSGGGTGGGGQPASSSSGAQQGFRSGPSQAGGGKSTLGSGAATGAGGLSGGLGGAGGGGGDDGDERRAGKRPEPVDKMEVEEEEEEKPRVGEEAEQGKVGAAAPPGGVLAASDGAPGAEAAAEAPPDPEDAAAALLMLLPLPRTPSSTAPTPPHAESSNASASTSASGDAAAVAAAQQQRKKRTSDESRPSPGPSLNPRSTRRHSKLPESPAPEPEPIASTSKGKGKKARISDAAPSERRASITRAGTASRPVEAPPSLEARRTRSQPLPGKLQDVLYAPETLAATGGYDFEKGRYISKFEATRDPSHNPLPPRLPTPSPPPTPARKAAPAPAPAPKAARPPPRTAATATAKVSTPRALVPSTSRASRTSIGSSSGSPAAPSPAPPEGVRSTRRSFPIAQPLRDLIYSPAAVAANGGWDAAAGKYVSAASASQGPAASSSSGRRASSAAADGASSSRKRPASPAVAQPASASAPPADVRSTRRSFPMAGTRISDLVYSPAARLVAGGWDPVAGRYVSAAKGDAPSGSGAQEGARRG
ncbi:histone lysine methyltransferase Set9 [Rhodotorula kratochvilovae]